MPLNETGENKGVDDAAVPGPTAYPRATQKKRDEQKTKGGKRVIDRKKPSIPGFPRALTEFPPYDRKCRLDAKKKEKKVGIK